MQKLRYGVFLIFLTGLLMFLFSERYAPIRAKFQRPQPRFYSALPVYSHEETPFYQPTQSPNFILINTFKNIRTWSNAWSGGIWDDVKPLLIVADTILIAGYIEDEFSDTFYDQSRTTFDLFAVDINTGTIQWQTVIGKDLLATDGERVYVQAASEAFEAVHIVALDLQSGDQLWDTRLDGWYAISSRYLAATDSEVIAVTYNKGNDAQYRLNSETGEIKERRLYGFVETRPHYANLIFTQEGYYQFGPLRANRAEDGVTIWRYDKTVVSNIAIGGTISYFVTEDAQLIAVESLTGKQVGQIQFSPAFPAEFDFSNNDMIVAAAEDLVAVYFADQQQLSLFRFILHNS